MKKITRFFLWVLIVLAILGMVHDRLLGMAAEPALEKLMTQVFDMPVSINGMRIAPFLGRISVKELVILNPTGFRRRDHFTCNDFVIDLDLRVLKNKFIRIRKAHFREVIFAIESYMTPQGSRTNVWHWYHNMGLDEDGPPIPPRAMPHPENIGEDSWRVRIDRLELENGTLIFDDRREAEEQRWIFHHLNGYWTVFDFLSDYVSPTFTEYIKLEGSFGANPPARFEGEGKCQFADGDNFDVNTLITEGSAEEYAFLLSGILGEVRGGTYDLKSHLLCVEGHLTSEHRLTLKSIKLAAPTAAQKLFKYPFGAIRLLLEDQKILELDIRVDGDISDPKFRVLSAFTKAFQRSMVNKTKAGIKGTVKIAADTPNQLFTGLGKIGSVLTDPFGAKNGANAELDEGNDDVRN